MQHRNSMIIKEINIWGIKIVYAMKGDGIKNCIEIHDGHTANKNNLITQYRRSIRHYILYCIKVGVRWKAYPDICKYDWERNAFFGNDLA